MFQICESEDTVFDAISYYTAFKKYLLFLGQFPTQSSWSQKFNVTLSTCSVISMLLPALAQFCASIAEKDIDTAMECIPPVVTMLVCMIKLLNHKCHKKEFDKLFHLMKEEWLTNDENEMYVLDKVTRQGNLLAEAYRITLLSCMAIFFSLPLLPAFLNVVLPRNETRQRQQLFKLKYFINEDDHFYSIYLHSIWASFVTVIIVVAMDSLHMMVVHHVCALFTICGHEVIRQTERLDIETNRLSVDQFKECVEMHQKAIRFFEIMDESTRLSYFFQILCNMIGITVTSVQTLMYRSKPEEAFRIAVFLVSQQFHLLILTLPGQILQDHCSDLHSKIYSSRWYQMPLNIQKLVYTMLMRSGKVCKLTAGGLYEMNIENFGIMFALYISLRQRNTDTASECVAHLSALIPALIKVLNIHYNRENFKKLFGFVVKEWEELKLSGELPVLEEVTARGTRLAQAYRSICFFLAGMFLLVPLIFPILDIVLPLNETRPRLLIFKVNYLVINAEDHFYFVYLHLAWSAFVTAMSIITVDSLFIVTVYHISGLFALCGYRLKNATGVVNLTDKLAMVDDAYEHVKRSAITYDKAIQFYNILKESSKNRYLITVGLNMIGISVTATQIVVNLDRPEEALKSVIFFGASQIHLLTSCIPGQVLLDYSMDLANDIYSCKWYQIPVEVQRMLHIMQIRSNRPCTLTAGGISEINIENFGKTFKICMSYCTSMVSLRE